MTVIEHDADTDALGRGADTDTSGHDADSSTLGRGADVVVSNKIIFN